MLLAALCSVGKAQRMDYVNVENHTDGKYVEESSGVRITGRVLDGKKSGIWIESHANSELPHFIRQYLNGVLDGISIDIDKQGSITRQAEYKDGKLDGCVMRWGRAGRIIDIVNYKDGQKDGAAKICYDKGTVQEESNYKQGKRDGVTVWYGYNDKTQGPKIALYTYKDGLFHGVQETYYENGNVKTRKQFENNVQVDVALEFYEDGSVKTETKYKNGEISGKVREYKMGKKTL